MRPRFETSRLELREWTPDDAPAAFGIYSDPEVVRFLGRALATDPVVERERFADLLERNRQRAPRGLGSWALAERATGTLVGHMLLKPLPPTTDEIEVGWHLARGAWGRGYASEAAARLLRYGFEDLRLDEILAVVNPLNVRSAAVARRIGMRWRERTTRYYDGLELDLFAVTPDAVAGRAPA